MREHFTEVLAEDREFAGSRRGEVVREVGMKRILDHRFRRNVWLIDTHLDGQFQSFEASTHTTGCKGFVWHNRKCSLVFRSSPEIRRYRAQEGDVLNLLLPRQNTNKQETAARNSLTAKNAEKDLRAPASGDHQTLCVLCVLCG